MHWRLGRSNRLKKASRPYDLELVPIFIGFLDFIDRKPTQTPESLFEVEDANRLRVSARSFVPPTLTPWHVTVAIGGAVAIAAVFVSGLPNFTVDVLAVGGIIAIGWAVWPKLRHAYRHRQTRFEANVTDLIKDETKLLRRRFFLALEEFRVRLASGEFNVFERQPDGTLKALSDAQLQAFTADHGRNLILESDPEFREMVRTSARPVGALFIRKNSIKSMSMLSSRSFIDEPDSELFDKQKAWLIAQAELENLDSKRFTHALEVIEGLRNPKVKVCKGEEVSQKLAELKHRTASKSVIEKLMSGSYPPFETVLSRMPLEGFPRGSVKSREK